MIRYNRLGYVALNVTDLDRSERFYRDLIGLEAMGPGPEDCRLLRCDSYHHSVVLCRGERPGLKRIGFEMESVQALEALCAALTANGIAYQEVAREACTPFHLGRCVRMRDPVLGASFDFFESMHELARPFAPTVAKIQRLGHVVLKTPRHREAVRFFTDVLNFRVSDEVDGAVSFLRAYPNPLHHSLAISRGDKARLHHVNFMVSEVDDIGKAMWRFQREAVPVVSGPGRHPPSGSMFFYYLDPDGLTLEYSLGMEEFPEHGARKHRVLERGRSSIDSWGAPVDPRMGAVGDIEPDRAPVPA